jgi:signal transduction histidine kinase
MSMDVRTLLVVHTVATLTLAALMAAFWRAHRSTPGLGLWALGTASIGFGVLAAALRGILPDALSIVGANAAGVAGVAALWNGIRAFDGRKVRWTAAVAAVLGVAAFLAHQTYVVDDILARTIVASAVPSLGCALCAYELWRGPARTLRGPAVLAALSLALVAATLGFRAASVVVAPPEPNLFAPYPAQSAHFVVALVSKILIVFSLLMMAAQRLQREIEARNFDLQAATDRAEDASRAKTEFLAMMSHELRTPLNAILGFSDVQRREMFGPLGHERYRQYAADIHSSGTHLLELITTILDISKAEAGKLEVAPIDLDPRAALEATIPLVTGQAEAKGIRLRVELPEAPLACRADPQALKQILLNLLSNALKFTPEGGAVTVRLRASAPSGIEFVVSDSGIGIAQADLPRLMKPFEQASRGYRERNGGTGLGLPLVDALVRLHGGTFRLESTPGAGTTATVRLPSAQGASPQARSTTPQGASPKSALLAAAL